MIIFQIQNNSKFLLKLVV